MINSPLLILLLLGLHLMHAGLMLLNDSPYSNPGITDAGEDSVVHRAMNWN